MLPTFNRKKTCLDVHLGLSTVVTRDIAQVPGVPLPLSVLGASVLALVQVEVGPRRGAPVGGVAKLVDVEPVQTLLAQVAQLAGDGNGRARGLKIKKASLGSTYCTTVYNTLCTF